jgi:hypothetical protein
MNDNVPTALSWLNQRLQADRFGRELFYGLFRHCKRCNLPPPPEYWDEMSSYIRGHLWRPAIYDMLFALKVPPMIDPNEGFKAYQCKGQPPGTLSNVLMRPYVPGETDNRMLVARQEPRGGDMLVRIGDRRALLMPREVFDLLYEVPPA